MSTQNTRISSAALGEWKVDPDHLQDRRSGPVIEITGEERDLILQKYQDNIKPINKPSMPWFNPGQKRRSCEDMGKLIYDEKKLLDLCREHGTGDKVYKIAAKELNLTTKQVENQIFNKGIRRILEKEKNEKQAEIHDDLKVIVAKEKISDEKQLAKEIADEIKAVITESKSEALPIAKPKTITKYDRHNELIVELNTVYSCKNKDYGDAFGKTFQELGVISAVTRMYDKFNRIKTLAKGIENKVTDESIKDTLKDLANYCLMTLIELEVQGGAHYDT